MISETAVVLRLSELDLLIQAQDYLTCRSHGLRPNEDLEEAWKEFYDRYFSTIRKFAFSCGATEESIGDCTQDVWSELLARLPSFRLDPARGKFDTWLFHIVRGKSADLHRSNKRNPAQERPDCLEKVTDRHPSPSRIMEEQEILTLAWSRVSEKLAACNLQVLQMRLLEERSVAEVAEELNLSPQQVWYRYHRARRELAEITEGCSHDKSVPNPHSPQFSGKSEKMQKPAQGSGSAAVSRCVGSSTRVGQGGNRVDWVFHRLELGRREVMPEWKVEWDGDGTPKPVLYIRTMALVAYAEMCGPSDFIAGHWPCIVNAAIAAGVAAGIATIVATPTGALPIFQAEFHKQLQGKGGSAVDEKIQVALSAKLEPNGPWSGCKE